MQSLNLLVRHLRRPAVLALLALAAFTPASHAVSVRSDVYAKGRWALVVPGSGTGGHVVWDSGRGCYITDRVSRGETVCVTYRATFAGEVTRNSGYRHDCGTYQCGAVPLPFSYNFTVPTTAGCNNLAVWIQTNCDYKCPSLPIGSRP